MQCKLLHETPFLSLLQGNRAVISYFGSTSVLVLLSLWSCVLGFLFSMASCRTLRRCLRRSRSQRYRHDCALVVVCGQGGRESSSFPLVFFSRGDGTCTGTMYSYVMRVVGSSQSIVARVQGACALCLSAPRVSLSPTSHWRVVLVGCICRDAR